MRWMLAILTATMFLPGALANDDAWTLHAQSDISASSERGLTEFYVPLALQESPAQRADDVHWTWWSWSDETGSSWPDDDALYRASTQNITINASSTDATLERHSWPASAHVEVQGKVRVVSAEDGARMIAFDLDITPLVNLSDHTILYVVLTEDEAYDQHQRSLHHLVREMRPEVGFSVKANNTTSLVSMLPADHLDAAGVDLIEVPTGWSYTVAVFGSPAEVNLSSHLLWMAHGPLPSPSHRLTANQAWTPVLLTAIAVVIASSIIGALSRRERAIPQLQASWVSADPPVIDLRVNAGSHPFRITSWSVQSPWNFKGRPSRLTMDAGEERILRVEFRVVEATDCHLEAAIEIDDFGAWKQHLWLKTPSTNDGGPKANPPE